MNEQEMWDALVNVVDTDVWKAMQLFADSQDAHVLASIASIDPFKDPTSLARYQGYRNGIRVLMASITKKKEERDKAGENTES